MTTETVVTLPDRVALRALYDAAVADINPTRGNILTNGFYAKTGDAVFNAGYMALSDAVTDTHRMLTVSAPAGGGKTSFSYALAIAVTRYAESNPSAPYGVVFLVDQRSKADEVYRDLEPLLPGKVKVWTKDHDTHCQSPEKVTDPAARFSKSDLLSAPVIIVTHNFYLDKNGHQARTVVRNGSTIQRALTIVDELPEEAPSLTITLAQAQTVREALVEANPEIKPHMDALFPLLEQFNNGPANQLCRPGKELPWSDIHRDLWWFQSKDAALLAKAHTNTEAFKNFFAFARAFVVGRGWAATDGLKAEFFAYEDRRIIDKAAGTILLDATADIDGISPIVPWRVEIETPTARYDNLEIILVPQHTKVQLRKYLSKASNQRSYVQWMTDTILQNTEPEQKALVVCKLSLFEEERVPTWPQGDDRFKNAENYTKGFQWDLEDRKLCATHWGTGIGSNEWQDADTVLLFDEFILPKSAAISRTQGLRAQRVDQGDLGGMKNFNSKAPGVTSIADGHVLRWIRQMALRGSARTYDEHGMCGRQRLVIACDPKRFMANVSRLFPGVSNIRIVGTATDNATVQTEILGLLSNSQDRVVTQKAISKAIGKAWRSIAHYVNTSAFQSSVSALGWRYVNPKGCKGSSFERLMPNQSEGVLSAYM